MGTEMTAAQRMARAKEWLDTAEQGGGWFIEKDDLYPVLNNFRITVRRAENADLEYLSELLVALAGQTFPNGALVNGKPVAAPSSVGHVWWSKKTREGGESAVDLWQILVSGGGLATPPPVPTLEPGHVPDGPTLDTIYSNAENVAGNAYGAVFTEVYPSQGKIIVCSKYHGFDKAAKDLLLYTITSAGIGLGARNRSMPQLDDDTGRWNGEIESFLDADFSSGFFNQTGVDEQISEMVNRNGKVYQIRVLGYFTIQRDDGLGLAGAWTNFQTAGGYASYVTEGIKMRGYFTPQGSTASWKAYWKFTEQTLDVTSDFFSGGSRDITL